MARSTTKSDLNLVPVMNMVTILIPFLLMSAAFTSVAVVPVDVSPAGKPTTVEEPEERPSLAVTPKGFLFTGVDGASELLPCPTGCARTQDYDLEGLTRTLEVHKATHGGTALELLTDDAVAYDVLIAVLDSSRSAEGEDLYPNVIFGRIGG